MTCIWHVGYRYQFRNWIWIHERPLTYLIVALFTSGLPTSTSTCNKPERQDIVDNDYLWLKPSEDDKQYWRGKIAAKQGSNVLEYIDNSESSYSNDGLWLAVCDHVIDFKCSCTSCTSCTPIIRGARVWWFFSIAQFFSKFLDFRKWIRSSMVRIDAWIRNTD